jgi:signal transduction histidine kinase
MYWTNITRHEMRNPLSAILQSADEIGMSLSEFLSTLDESTATQKLTALLDSSVEAAQTISLCAQHQVRSYVQIDGRWKLTRWTRNALSMISLHYLSSIPHC